jgi:hypothetical protein
MEYVTLQKKDMKINKPMPDQTIGITKIVRAAKAQKEVKKTMRMANAMAMADSMKQGPLHHNIILKKK